MRGFIRLMLILCLIALPSILQAADAERVRLIIETDAGGDPDDEQSLVRFLLYANEWDVEGIIAARPAARDGENLNVHRAGLGIVQATIDAYGECRPKLVLHDPRYPTRDELWQRTVPGYGADETSVKLVIDAVDRDDPRPIWFCNWGTDDGSASSSLKRALDRVRRERGPDGYAAFKNKIRLSSADKFGEHTFDVSPPFKLWVDTFRPEIAGKRWYHRFSAITAKAGGFDIEGDVRTKHGPLGALYPLNTTHPQKEGDTMTFLYLVPTGMNDPIQPTWGSWAGRYAQDERTPWHYWATAHDTCNGSTSRENTLARWAVHLQNDFKARMNWCVRDFAEANHPPTPRVKGSSRREAKAGEIIELDASESRDVDDNPLRYEWIVYPEASDYRGEPIAIIDSDKPIARVKAPTVDRPTDVHFILILTDQGDPPLTRYARIVVTVRP